MRKLLMLAVVAGALCFAGSASKAEAGSVYFGVGGPRVGFGYGYPGYGYGGYGSGYGWGGYRGGWGGYGGYGWNNGWNGGWNHGCYRPPIHRW